ncbi:MAG: geranylgeranylglycerol-phosphate geranylgeranyltransferase [Flavobacteriaceae bacterium]|nr:geranylgeranylglycerol-phosphate geranylgeranyltransferase [Flavobacteriaceae bacterium]
MNYLPFLQLIRWKNLVILAATLLIIKFGFINIFTTNYSLDYLRFVILLASIISIAAAGYIINDIYDIEIDQINKPYKLVIGKVFTISQAYNMYFIFNIFGVLMGFYLANYLEKPIYSGLFIMTSFLLYYYSSTLKKVPLIGNIVVASLIGFCILLCAYFDLIINTSTANLGMHYLLFELILEFSVFAFLINLIREIVKDIEDIKGDKELNIKTLPLLIGIKYSKYVIGLFTLILIISILYFTFSYIPRSSFIFYYFLLAIFLPLLYFIFRLRKSKTKTDYSLLSKILKFCMITGILSILLISLTIKNVI